MYSTKSCRYKSMTMRKRLWIFSDKLEVDKGWSWVLVLLLCCVNVLTFGFIKSFGVFYSQLLIDYGEDQVDKFALMPVMAAITSGAGSVGMPILQRFNNRVVLISGSLLTSFGIIAGSLVFTGNTAVVYILLSIPTGFGVGICLASSYYTLTRYFSTYLPLATSLMLLGSSVGALIFPYIIYMLTNQYGLRGGLLLCGGIILHLLPLSCLIVSDNHHKEEIYQSIDSEFNIKEDSQSQPSDENAGNKTLPNYKFCRYGSDRSVVVDNTEDCKEELETNPLLPSRSKSNIFRNMYNMISVYIIKSKQIIKKFLKLFKKINDINVTDILKSCGWVQKPLLIVYIITFAMADSSMVALPSIIPAKAVDMNLPRKEIALVVTLIGASDVIGRVTLGPLSNLKCLRGHQYVFHCATCLCMALTIVVHVVLSDVTSLYILSLVYGAFGGLLWIFIPVLLIEEFGVEDFQNVFSSTVPFIVPFAIMSNFLCQYLREWTATWDVSFMVCAIELFVAAAVFIVKLVPYVINKVTPKS